MSLLSLQKDLKNLSNKKRAKISESFFKTGKGEYGEGDEFIGVTVPHQRKIAEKYANLKLEDIQKLLSSKIHEHRLTGVFILVNQFNKGTKDVKDKIYKFYLKNSKQINNWDLVDSSASYIVGSYLKNKKRTILYTLAGSKNLWEKRIAIIATHSFIKNNDFKDTLKISQILLKDKHDLIHKAVGWMLREVGKKDQVVLEDFLHNNIFVMARTTLRYSIEQFLPSKRKYYLNHKVV